MPIPIDGGGGDAVSRMAGYFVDIARWFTDTAEAMEGVPFVGEYLSVPFHHLAWHFRQLRVQMQDFHTFYCQVLDFLRGLEDGWFLSDLIESVWSDWKSFISDPTLWVSLKLADILPYYGDLRYRAQYWVLGRLRELNEDLWDFVYYPRDWIVARLTELDPGLGDFFRDPRAFIVGKLSEVYPDFIIFLQMPSTWLRAQMSEALGVSGAFWEDPFGEILRKVLNKIDRRFGQYREQIVSVGERLLLRLWE